MTHHETKQVSTVGELIEALAKYDPKMPLMDRDGEDLRVTRLSNKAGQAIEIRTWHGEESPL